ncbi:MAG: hypothetical protein ABSH36_04925 [Solirubrobacteraceae bacterium]
MSRLEELGQKWEEEALARRAQTAADDHDPEPTEAERRQALERLRHEDNEDQPRWRRLP